MILYIRGWEGGWRQTTNMLDRRGRGEKQQVCRTLGTAVDADMAIHASCQDMVVERVVAGRETHLSLALPSSGGSTASARGT